MKNDEQLKTDIYRYIKTTALYSEVNGELSKTKRPKDSRLEDIVISVKSNTNGQKQIAYVNVHIYSPAMIIDRQKEEDTARLNVLCTLSADAFESFFIDGVHYTLNTQRVTELNTDEYLINNEIKCVIINEN